MAWSAIKHIPEVALFAAADVQENQVARLRDKDTDPGAIYP